MTRPQGFLPFQKSLSELFQRNFKPRRKKITFSLLIEESVKERCHRQAHRCEAEGARFYTLLLALMSFTQQGLRAVLSLGLSKSPS